MIVKRQLKEDKDKKEAAEKKAQVEAAQKKEHDRKNKEMDKKK